MCRTLYDDNFRFSIFRFRNSYNKIHIHIYIHIHILIIIITIITNQLCFIIMIIIIIGEDMCVYIYQQLRSISEISSCFFGPRPWHIEIRHRVKKTSTTNLFGFETLKLKIRRSKLWKATVGSDGETGVQDWKPPFLNCMYVYIYIYIYIYISCVYIYIYIHIHMCIISHPQ